MGDMGELGEAAAALHAEIGAFARDAGIERLLALGPLSAHAVAAFGERRRALPGPRGAGLGGARGVAART